MNKTLILYENDSIKIKDILNKVGIVIPNSKMQQINDEPKNIDSYSNILVAVFMEDENHFNLYKKLREYNIDFTDKKLVIVCIGSAKQDVIKYITKIQEIAKKSDLYYYFINIEYENVIEAATNIKKYIEAPKRNKHNI